MKWHFTNTGFNSGEFNMKYDLDMAKKVNPGEAYFRIYRWEPYCISLGANQKEESVNREKAHNNNIGIVKRPTGGRAILHAEELTYSVVVPIDIQTSARNLYQQINLALLKGLKIYDQRLSKVELENTQPDFQNFYKEDKSAICFAVSAKSELKHNGKKLVGSAQRKIGSTILQHGSILCGNYHENIVNYLELSNGNFEELRTEITNTTTDLNKILNDEINYEKLGNALLEGFEEFFETKMFELKEEISVEKQSINI